MTRVPHYCAEDRCRYHTRRAEPGGIIRYGSHRHLEYGRVQRFRCKACGRTFSQQTMRMDYYVKQRIRYRSLLGAFINCGSIRGTARELSVSRSVVTNRLMRLSWKSLEELQRFDEQLKLNEDLAADGFESFCVSRYFPNNIHLLAGSRSQYAYGFDVATIRRKGTMTEVQKRKRSQLERRWRADPHGIGKSFSHIVEQAVQLCGRTNRFSMVLYTDKKRDYSVAFEQSVAMCRFRQLGRFTHRSISSRAYRGVNNPLFPVNYLDREFRKDLREHVRKTVCFARNQLRQMQRLAVYVAEHNSGKPFRVNQRVDQSTTHAQIAGIAPETIRRIRLGRYTRRAWFTKAILSSWQEKIWRGQIATPLKESPQLQPRFALHGISYPLHRERRDRAA